MIAVLRSELYRTLMIRSGWLSIAVAVALGLATAWFDTNFWSLFAGLAAFGLIYVMTKGGPNDLTLFYLLNLYRQAFEFHNMGYASAMAWVLLWLVLRNGIASKLRVTRGPTS